MDTMGRVLVTGASGFVGGHLVEGLVGRGEQVRCLVRKTSNVSHLEPLGVELVHGDLSHPLDWSAIIHGVDVVYHVAGKTCAYRARELTEVNMMGTHQLARACARRTSPPTLVVMSSMAAAGPSCLARPRRPSDPVRPVSNYGRSKRAGEQAAGVWAGQLPLTILRPGIVFGPRNREMLPIFRSIFRLRIHAVPGFAALRLSLIHIDDLVEIAWRAARQGSRVRAGTEEVPSCGSGYYVACSPEHPTYAELGRTIARALGIPHVLLLPLPGPIVWFAAASSQLAAKFRQRPDTFNLDKMREATAGSWIGSSESLWRDLRFAPPLSLHERMTQTAEWYVDSGWL